MNVVFLVWLTADLCENCSHEVSSFPACTWDSHGSTEMFCAVCILVSTMVHDDFECSIASIQEGCTNLKWIRLLDYKPGRWLKVLENGQPYILALKLQLICQLFSKLFIWYRELMKWVGSHGSLLLLLRMKVTVWHFCVWPSQGSACTHCCVTLKLLLWRSLCNFIRLRIHRLWIFRTHAQLES